ncbi:uncharacterized protein LOC116779422 isoform X2 [Danaus plexippus]|uniref:uncharacterized protein LOC116779422 isoform X2 n=1 Tax=Danaus plexippus TaxID=13037 RepID=UPI002AAF44BE|nr:uncharacterized protein LOC116779422 isoform X2 [Danaus plexippus]
MLLYIILYNVLTVDADTKCISHEITAVPKYYLIEKCHRSKLGVASKANFSTLNSCRRLALEKKALALNFSPSGFGKIGRKPVEYTCEVLKYAESEGGLSLRNDTNYDYYSIYAKHLPNVNSCCVPLAGMFYLLSEKNNYTEAERRCRNMSSVLAGVFNQHRTDTLAQVLASSGVEAAYVGLGSNNGRVFRTTHGDSLDCITYRAWAPGHPRRNLNMSCVVLTREHTWKTTLCRKRYPALCELLPDGPYRKGTIFQKTDITLSKRSILKG